MLYFILGLIAGTMFFELIIINFIYIRKVALFNDIILTKKSEERLRKFYNKDVIKYIKTHDLFDRDYDDKQAKDDLLKMLGEIDE